MGVERMYTVREVAQLVAVSRFTVVKWIVDGELQAMKLGRVVRISESALKGMIARLSGGYAPAWYTNRLTPDGKRKSSPRKRKDAAA